MIAEAEARAQKIIDTSRVSAEQAVEQMKQQVSAECEQIKAQASHHLEQAVQLIMGKVVNPDGRS